MKEQSIFYFSPYLLRKYEITDVGNEEYSKLKVSYGTLRGKFKGWCSNFVEEPIILPWLNVGGLR